MNQASEPISEVDAEQLISRLHSDAEKWCNHIGFVRACLGNRDFNNKFGDALEGRAADTALHASATCVILFCARAWDRRGDAMALPRATVALKDVDRLERRRRTRRVDRVGLCEIESLQPDLKDFLELYTQVASRSTHDQLRALRTERYVHNLVTSRDRGDLTDERVNAVTYDELISFAEDTLELIDRTRYLWAGIGSILMSHTRISEDATRSLWAQLPTFQ